MVPVGSVFNAIQYNFYISVHIVCRDIYLKKGTGGRTKLSLPRSVQSDPEEAFMRAEIVGYVRRHVGARAALSNGAALPVWQELKQGT